MHVFRKYLDEDGLSRPNTPSYRILRQIPRLYRSSIYIYHIYVRWEPCTPPTEIPSQTFHIYVIITIYTGIISLDADFDEDSDSDLRLEIGAHLDLVFEG